MSFGNDQLSLLIPETLCPISTLKSVNDESITFPASNSLNLIVYWSLFCHSCIEEMPEIQKRLKTSKLENLKAFFISLDTNRMQVALKNFIKKRHIKQTVLMEEIASQTYLTADKWGVTTTPTFFITSKNGKILFSHEGPIDIDILIKKLASLNSPKIEKEKCSEK